MNEPQPRHFYERLEEGRYAPSVLVTGPWDKRFQNGVALIGLAAHLAEQSCAAGMTVARLVVDILSPLAMAPLTAAVTKVRDGRRLQLMQIDFEQDNKVMLRTTALHLRDGQSPVTPVQVHDLAPEDLPTFNGKRSPFRHVCETRLESGGLESPGPGVAWASFTGEIVEGTSISPFVQTAMASDFGSGLSTLVDWREWSFANVDLSLHLTRMPMGPWVRIAAETRSAGNGMAIVDTHLADLGGALGHAHQTLFLDRRPK